MRFNISALMGGVRHFRMSSIAKAKALQDLQSSTSAAQQYGVDAQKAATPERTRRPQVEISAEVKAAAAAAEREKTTTVTPITHKD